MALRLLILLAATLLDRFVGDPDWLWRRVPHPVVWIGWAIDRLDKAWNRPEVAEKKRRADGVAAIVLLCGGGLVAGLVLHWLLTALGLPGAALEAVVVAIFLAQKSLADHVRRVADALQAEGLAGGRRAVSMIVGRDPEQLDAAGVCRAAIESLAENASDGVVAPWLWYLVFGLPGLFVYKVLNTADSMIGHMSERHRAFGRAAAKLDDIANWPAARLTALLFAIAALLARGPAASRAAITAARRDAPLHRSPNAGWPEAAMAGALGLALGGPRRYGEVAVEAPMLNAGGRREAGTKDIAAALRLFAILSAELIAIALILLVASL